MKKNLLILILLSIFSYFITPIVEAQTACNGTVEPPAQTTFCKGVSVASDIKATSIPDSTGFENYALIILNNNDLDTLGHSRIITSTPDGSFDFNEFPVGTYSFVGFGYNQSQLDTLSMYVPQGDIIFCMPFPSAMYHLPINDLLDIMINNLSPEGLTLTDFTTSLRLLEPIGINFDYCLSDYDADTDAVPAYTIEVLEDSPKCRRTHIGSSGSPKAVLSDIDTIGNKAAISTKIAQAQAACNGTVEPPAQTFFCKGVSVASDIKATSFPTPTDTGFESYAFLMLNNSDLASNGQPKILDTISIDGSFDFNEFPVGTYSFVGFGYNQSQLDALAVFLNANPALAGIIGISAESLPLPVPLPLNEFLNVIRSLSPDGLTVSDLQSVIGVFASLGIPIDYCLSGYDEDAEAAIPAYTITVSDDASNCPATHVGGIISSPAVLSDIDTTTNKVATSTKVAQARAIPTMSEWGLILLTLLLLMFSTLYIGEQQVALGQIGRKNQTQQFTFSNRLPAFPFVPKVFMKTLTWVGLIVVAIFGASILWTGTITLADFFGTLICAPVLAYLLHLWFRNV